MIVRKEADGQTILIAQTDHSRLVGQLAAHWGNADFATPRPYESVARAAAFHDFGWLRYETAPYFDPATGETPPFFRVPFSERQLEAYRWCRDELLVDDPYAGMLVGMHRTGLWRGRYGAITHPPHPIPPSLPPAVEEFIDRAETVQALECSMSGATEVWTNYQLLQVWDQLGLYFTCQDPVPAIYRAGADRVRRQELCRASHDDDAGIGEPSRLRALPVRRQATVAFNSRGGA